VADLDRESILGLDNIRLALPVAGVGSRTLAAALDYLCLGVLVLLWALLCAFLLIPIMHTWAIAILLFGVFLLEWGYFAGFEIATGGRTLGKMALKLRVVSSVGATPGPAALILRNLLRDVDLIVGVPLLALDPLSRRLGDRMAGTLVVHEQRATTGPWTTLGRTPPGWDAREVGITEAFLARAAGMPDVVQRDAMARQLLARVERDAPELLSGIDQRNPVYALRRALAVEGR
jgi:uncharacterized RDD family membrane protein YckC